MNREPSEEELRERVEVWKDINWWRKKLGYSYAVLGLRAGFPEDLVRRGDKGAPVPVMHALRDFVRALNKRGARNRSMEDTEDNLSIDECKNLLRRPSPEEGEQGEFW